MRKGRITVLTKDGYKLLTNDVKQIVRRLGFYEDYDELGRLVRLSCTCDCCKHGSLDLKMSGTELGLLYSCKLQRNIWRTKEGFCNFGEYQHPASELPIKKEG